MDTRIDLDLAAEQIELRRPAWAALGLEVGPTTWRRKQSATPGADVKNDAGPDLLRQRTSAMSLK